MKKIVLLIAAALISGGFYLKYDGEIRERLIAKTGFEFEPDNNPAAVAAEFWRSIKYGKLDRAKKFSVGDVSLIAHLAQLRFSIIESTNAGGAYFVETELLTNSGILTLYSVVTSDDNGKFHVDIEQTIGSVYQASIGVFTRNAEVNVKVAKSLFPSVDHNIETLEKQLSIDLMKVKQVLLEVESGQGE